MIDITFDRAPEELAALCRDGWISAARFLALMEPEPEETVEEALQWLEEQQIDWDLTDLPAVPVTGEAAVRLHMEEQLAASADLMSGLEAHDPLLLYLQELAAVPAAGDPAVLAAELLEGRDVQELLVNLLLSRVVEAARCYAGRGVLLMDLIQEGSLGLWQAVLHYQGEDIEPWADRWIHRYMAQAVTMQARALGLGQMLRQGLSDYVDTDQRLLVELGSNPTVEEIAQSMHITPAEAVAYEAMLQNARSRQQVDADREPEERSQEEEQAVEDTAYFQTRQAVDELLSQLTQKEMNLLSLRYGLEGGLPLNPQETGLKLGMSAKEVVAQEAAILAKLRHETAQ